MCWKVLRLGRKSLVSNQGYLVGTSLHYICIYAVGYSESVIQCLSIVCLLYPIGVKRALRVTISGPNPGGITFSFLLTVFVLLYFL